MLLRLEHGAGDPYSTTAPLAEAVRRGLGHGYGAAPRCPLSHHLTVMCAGVVGWSAKGEGLGPIGRIGRWGSGLKKE